MPKNEDSEVEENPQVAPDPESGELVNTEENPSDVESRIKTLETSQKKTNELLESVGNALDTLINEKYSSKTNPPQAPPIITEHISPAGDPIKAMESVAKLQDMMAKTIGKQMLDGIKLGTKMTELQIRSEAAEERAEDAEEMKDQVIEKFMELREADGEEKPINLETVVKYFEQAMEIVQKRQSGN